MISDTGAAHGLPDQPGFLSEAECRDLHKRCVAIWGEEHRLEVQSSWDGTVRWARNRAYLSSDVKTVDVSYAGVNLDRLDDAGLRASYAEFKRKQEYTGWGRSMDPRPWEEAGPLPMLKPKLWSDATAQFDQSKRTEVVRDFIETVESAGMLSAGSFLISSRSDAVFGPAGLNRYYPTTRVEFSTTVRDAKGTGSGWAGTDDYDVTRVDVKALGKIALDKCLSSVNPVAIEPGRYTTILEPQALADLFRIVVREGLDRQAAEDMQSIYPPPFWLRPGQSKIGLRVLDPRFDLRSDPMDPIGGFRPFVSYGEPYTPVNWIEKGYLRELSYGRYYGVQMLGEDKSFMNSNCWRLSGGTTTREEMIATTKRGLIVTRFHGVEMTHWRSATCTGFTRDGVWLIEDGKISKPVKNFRFTESPLFALNKVEQIGPVQRVFAGPRLNETVPDGAMIAPIVKVLDFNFTQLSDAV